MQVLKVSKFQKAFTKSSFLQKYECQPTGEKSLQILVHILGGTMTS